MGFARLLLGALAPAGARSRLTVLIYHRVLAAPDPLRPGEPTAPEFEARMRWLKANFNVIPLVDAVAGLKAGRLPARPLAITFDDGYRDNHDLAAPILAKLGLPATFFVATGFLDGGIMFNDSVIESVRQARGDALDLSALGMGRHPLASVDDRRRAIAEILKAIKPRPTRERGELAARIAEAAGATLPRALMMSSGQVAALHGSGMTVGAHTATHPILARTDAATARAEIESGRQRLEAIIGAPVRLFAYPNGKPQADYTAEHVAMARELGFEGAVSTAWGAASPGDDPYQVPRFTPWDRAEWKAGLRLAQNLRRRDFAGVAG
jgi:peptidoglycan/xylan/chitin deacetylase (PgdA/CDA1 family)